MRNRSDYVRSVLPWVVVLAFWLNFTQVGEAGLKKLIYFGWGTRDTQYIRDHWQEMEKMPFDGIGIFVALDRQAWQQGKRSSYNHFGPYVMGPKAFRIEDFQAAIDDLKAVKWQIFTDNFFPIMLSSVISEPGFNWFDDERWRIITNNFAVMATIAAKAGAKGLILDPEHYNYQMFNFSIHRKTIDKAFEEYVQKARQRGRQVMTAIASHLPDAVIFSISAYSAYPLLLGKDDSLQSATHALLPAFFDGLLEAMPPGASFVDGYALAYGFKERKQFIEARRHIREEAIKLSALPDRYREKVRAGFGLWLDNRRRPNYFRPNEFRQALSDALDVSDGYVWIYSEGPKFFPPSDIEPAYIEAISRAQRAIKR